MGKNICVDVIRSTTHTNANKVHFRCKEREHNEAISENSYTVNNLNGIHTPFEPQSTNEDRTMVHSGRYDVFLFSFRIFGWCPISTFRFQFSCCCCSYHFHMQWILFHFWEFAYFRKWTLWSTMDGKENVAQNKQPKKKIQTISLKIWQK